MDIKNSINPVQIQKYLTGINYPVSKDTLIEKAKLNGAGEDIINKLKGFADRDYKNPSDIAQELGKLK